MKSSVEMTAENAESLPLVSVVIPTSNRHRLLNVAIGSVLNQTYRNIEVIVVDDCSDIPVDVESYDSNIVKIIRNDICKGGAVSRNIGARSSKGEYICFLDDDDWYFPQKIEYLFQGLNDNPEADAVFGRIFRGSGKYTEINFPNGHLTDIRKVGMLHTNSSLIRRKTFQKVYFYEKLQKFQDTQFHIELISTCKVYCLPEFVAYWRDEYVGNRITSMSSDEKIAKSVLSCKLMLDYFTDLHLSKLELDWLRRIYIRHLAKYSMKGELRGGLERCYYWLSRSYFIIRGRYLSA